MANRQHWALWIANAVLWLVVIVLLTRVLDGVGYWIVGGIACICALGSAVHLGRRRLQDSLRRPGPR